MHLGHTICEMVEAALFPGRPELPAPGLGPAAPSSSTGTGRSTSRPPAGQYVTSPAELVLLPGAARAVARLNAAGLRTVLVTNQRWLSGPSADPAGYAAVHARLEQLLAAEGAWLDAAYHCPHAAGICGCRKPAPGMLHRAARDHLFDLDKAVIIGDSDSDLKAGRPPVPRPSSSAPAPLARLLRRRRCGEDLPAAVRLILQDRNATA